MIYEGSLLYTFSGNYTGSYECVKEKNELVSNLRISQLPSFNDVNKNSNEYWLKILNINSGNILESSNLLLPRSFPNIEMINPNYFNLKEDSEKILTMFENHPSIKNIEQKIKATSKSIKLARENYKPQFSVNTSYAKREDDLMGRNRADLFSVGLTFDLPIFVKNKQDKELQVAMLKTKSVETEKILQYKKLFSLYETTKADLIRLKERQSLYLTKLLPQMNEQSEASLTAYTNDDGDFPEVVRSRISQLNAQIDILNINVDIQKNIVKYNYLFTDNAENIVNR